METEQLHLAANEHRKKQPEYLDREESYCGADLDLAFVAGAKHVLEAMAKANKNCLQCGNLWSKELFGEECPVCAVEKNQPRTAFCPRCPSQLYKLQMMKVMVCDGCGTHYGHSPHHEESKPKGEATNIITMPSQEAPGEGA